MERGSRNGSRSQNDSGIADEFVPIRRIEIAGRNGRSIRDRRRSARALRYAHLTAATIIIIADSCSDADDDRRRGEIDKSRRAAARLMIGGSGRRWRRRGRSH